MYSPSASRKARSPTNGYWLPVSGEPSVIAIAGPGRIRSRLIVATSVASDLLMRSPRGRGCHRLSDPPRNATPEERFASGSARRGDRPPGMPAVAGDGPRGDGGVRASVEHGRAVPTGESGEAVPGRRKELEQAGRLRGRVHGQRIESRFPFGHTQGGFDGRRPERGEQVTDQGHDRLAPRGGTLSV